MSLRLRLAALALCSSTASANFRSVCAQFPEQANIDPIGSPGKPTWHIHQISGNLGFGPTVSLEAMENSASTCDTVGDKSMYWAPAFYFHDPEKDGEMYALKSIFQPYYVADQHEVDVADPAVLAHPLRMVVGDATGASPKEMEGVVNFICTLNPPDPDHPDTGPVMVRTESPVAGWHPTATCDEYRIDYLFPSCWNGKPFSPDMSHVAYAYNTTEDRGICPKSHPRRFAELRVEQRVILPRRISWKDGKAPFSLASGGADTAHCDTILLWDTAVLNNLSVQCGTRDFNACEYNGVAKLDWWDQLAIAERFVLPKGYGDNGPRTLFVPDGKPTAPVAPKKPASKRPPPGKAPPGKKPPVRKEAPPPGKKVPPPPPKKKHPAARPAPKPK